MTYKSTKRLYDELVRLFHFHYLALKKRFKNADEILDLLAEAKRDRDFVKFLNIQLNYFNKLPKGSKARREFFDAFYYCTKRVKK